MLGLKLNHVSKRGHGSSGSTEPANSEITHKFIIQIHNIVPLHTKVENMEIG